MELLPQNVVLYTYESHSHRWAMVFKAKKTVGISWWKRQVEEEVVFVGMATDDSYPLLYASPVYSYTDSGLYRLSHYRDSETLKALGNIANLITPIRVSKNEIPHGLDNLFPNLYNPEREGVDLSKD